MELVVHRPSAAEFDLSVNPLAFDLRADIFSSGANGALQRWPKVECSSLAVALKAGSVPGWKPGWQRVRTVGVGFPEGIQFLPPKPATDEEPKQVAAAKPQTEDAEQAVNDQRKPTRIKPPADALSLEDRLFYILQPPLQTILAGQEMFVPFAPFQHQYEGIAWLYSQRSALLADEMGLGKTMQTITAVRTLLYAMRSS